MGCCAVQCCSGMCRLCNAPVPIKVGRSMAVVKKHKQCTHRAVWFSELTPIHPGSWHHRHGSLCKHIFTSYWQAMMRTATSPRLTLHCTTHGTIELLPPENRAFHACRRSWLELWKPEPCSVLIHRCCGARMLGVFAWRRLRFSGGPSPV